MKKSAICILLAASLAASAQAASEKLIKVEGNIGGMTDSSMGSIDLAYDAQNRLSSFKSGSSSMTLTDETITYDGNTVTVSGKINGSEGRQVYTLNADGLATECTVYDSSDAATEQYAFTYEGGRLKTVTETKGEKQSVTEFKYLAGSLVSLSNDIISATIVPGLTANVSGIPDLIQQSGVGSCTTALYAGLLGKGSLMMPKMITITLPKINIPLSLTMDYERDSKLRVTQLTASVASQQLVNVAYTYGDPQASVSDMAADAINVFAADGAIVNPSGSEIEVTAIDGRAAYRGNDRTVSLPAGIYIVNADGKTTKVVVD